MTSLSGGFHFGVSLPQISRTWEETRRAAETFEHLGYDSVWLNDHLYGVPLAEIPILEAWTALSAIGALTERVQLGTVVSPPGFRNPALMAKVVATLDQVTGGRVIPGLGAGWFEQEYRGYGFDFPPVRQRLEQLAEAA
jgi:alkanesulfonate monooxygenase SsuD/methylene tetrahydromethanopterin reductase-like flavin-dependent oxidoreductase (luciferase family)